MPTDPSNETGISDPAPAQTPAKAPRRLAAAAVAGLALLGLGAGAGAAGWSLTHHERASFDTGLATTPITKLSDGGPVEIQGKVVEIFGNKFVVEDAGGRALVETGRAGESGKLVAMSEAVTVQGRFEHGFLHASAFQRADGKVEELRPLPPPPPAGGPAPMPGPKAGPAVAPDAAPAPKV